MDATSLRGDDETVVPDSHSSQIVYAIGYGDGAFRTRNGGMTWQHIPGLPSHISGISVRPADGTVYAWTYRQIFESTDHG